MEAVDQVYTEIKLHIELKKLRLTSIYNVSMDNLCEKLANQLNEIYGYHADPNEWYFSSDYNELSFSAFSDHVLEVKITLGMMINPDDAIESYSRHDTKEPMIDLTGFLYENGFRQISFKHIALNNEPLFVFKY